jgi:hypothetical protein
VCSSTIEAENGAGGYGVNVVSAVNALQRERSSSTSFSLASRISSVLVLLPPAVPVAALARD